MKRIVFLYLGCLFLFSSTAYSMGTGSDMLSMCGAAVKDADGLNITESEGMDSLMCIAYLAGFTDAIKLSAQITKPQEPRICMPNSGVPTEQLARIMVKWLREHPENLHQSARMEIMIALSKTFPCK